MADEVLPGAPEVDGVMEEDASPGEFLRPDLPRTTITDDTGDGEPSVWSDAQRTIAYYNDCTLDVKYEFKTGWAAQVPMGPDGTPADPVKVHAGYWCKIVQWSYERMQDYPECPHWETDDPNELLLHAEIVPAKPLEGPDGLRVYRISGLYVYQLLSGGPPYRFSTGTTPESIAGQDDNAIEVGAYFDRSAIGRGDTDEGTAKPTF